MTARLRCSTRQTLRVDVRVEPGRDRHRPHGAGGRVEHDRGRALRVPAQHGVAQHGLRVRLDRVVERQVDVAAVAHRLRDDGVDRLAGGVLDDPLAAGPAGQLAVERELEPGEAAVVDARVAEHLRGERELRVEAPLLAVGVDPRQSLAAGASRRAPDPPCARRRRSRGCGRSATGRRWPGRGAACARSRAPRAAGPSPGAGRRRRSAPARRSRAARRRGRRSSRARPG